MVASQQPYPFDDAWKASVDRSGVEWMAYCEAAALVTNPNTCVIDASTAHRTQADCLGGIERLFLDHAVAAQQDHRRMIRGQPPLVALPRLCAVEAAADHDRLGVRESGRRGAAHGIGKPRTVP